MPYVKTDKAADLDNNGHIRESGDLNYLITNMIITDWLADPRYRSIHAIRVKYSMKPLETPEILGLKRGTTFTAEDLVAASKNAFDEFYRRVGARYEDYKRKEKGNVDPYISRGVLWETENMTKFPEKR